MYELAAQSSPMRALLIEDNLDDVALIQQMLRDHSAYVELGTAADLASALARLVNTSYDLILLDLSLPDSHGYDTLERLRAVAPRPPIILLIDPGDEELALRGVRNEAQDYLIKAKMTDYLLIRAIHYVVERKRAEGLVRKERELAQRVAEQTAELRIVNSELLHNARLKDEFLATVSHELRTPLSVILTLSEAMQDHIYGSLNDQQQKAIQRIHKSGRHLLALINDILDVSKIESGKFTLEIGPVSLPMLCEDSLQMVQELAQSKQIQITTRLDPHVTILYADGRRLLQVLLNLLNNAVKFTRPGGTVELTVNGDKDQEQVTIAIRDTGIGIDEPDFAKLFQPFVQLDSRLSRNYQGAGLGLALVYRLVNLHGGSVSVESVPDEGSCFSVQLPWQTKPEQSTASAPAAVVFGGEMAPNPICAGEVPLILLVEDQRMAVEAMDHFLRTIGYRVAIARTGVESVAQAHDQKPALILMDLQIPELDGIEAIRRIRQQEENIHTPIVALTALAMPGDETRCLAAGANAYLSKPVSLHTLSKVISTQLQVAAQKQDQRSNQRD